MKAGFIRVTKEILNSKDWPTIQSELNNVFKEVCREEVGNGIIKIHGESDLFEMMPEGSSQEYVPIFYNNSGEIKLKEIVTISEANKVK